MVIKDYPEPRFEMIFSPNSYGYRPNKNAHQALDLVRENCWKEDWVIDLEDWLIHLIRLDLYNKSRMS